MRTSGWNTEFFFQGFGSFTFRCTSVEGDMPSNIFKQLFFSRQKKKDLAAHR